jgi:hypothetical protein
MRISKFILVFLLLVTGISAFAQDDDKPAPYKRPTNDYYRDTVSYDQAKVNSFQPKKKFDVSKLFVEPVFNFYLDGNEVQFGLMPAIGYKVYKNLYVGGSIKYNIIYVSHLDGTTATPSVTEQVYGGGPLIQYNIWKGFFARFRFEMLAVRYPDAIYSGSNSTTGNPTTTISYATLGIPHMWLGGGYNFTYKKVISLPVAVYFNPLWGSYNGTAQAYSPYSWVYVQAAIYLFSPGH